MQFLAQSYDIGSDDRKVWTVLHLSKTANQHNLVDIHFFSEGIYNSDIDDFKKIASTNEQRLLITTSISEVVISFAEIKKITRI